MAGHAPAGSVSPQSMAEEHGGERAQVVVSPPTSPPMSALHVRRCLHVSEGLLGTRKFFFKKLRITGAGRIWGEGTFLL